MTKIKVEGQPGLVRDIKTGAILNINNKNIEQARKAKQMRREQHDQYKSLKYEVDQIKSLLQQLLEKIDG